MPAVTLRPRRGITLRFLWGPRYLGSTPQKLSKGRRARRTMRKEQERRRCNDSLQRRIAAAALKAFVAAACVLLAFASSEPEQCSSRGEPASLIGKYLSARLRRTPRAGVRSPLRAGTVAGRITAADHSVWRQHHRACLGPLRLGSRAHSGIHPARRRHQPRVFWLQLGGGVVSGCRGMTVLPASALPWTAPVMRLTGVYAGPC